MSVNLNFLTGRNFVETDQYFYLELHEFRNVNWELCGIWLCINLFRSLFLYECNTFKHTHTQIFFFCKEENEVLRTFIHLESCDKNVHLRLYYVVCAGMYLLCRLAEHILHRRHSLYSIFERVGDRHQPLHSFHFHCEMPPRYSRQARTGCRSFLQGQVNPASEVVRP